MYELTIRCSVKCMRGIVIKTIFFFSSSVFLNPAFSSTALLPLSLLLAQLLIRFIKLADELQTSFFDLPTD